MLCGVHVVDEPGINVAAFCSISTSFRVVRAECEFPRTSRMSFRRATLPDSSREISVS
jgi:hypothetical protein